MRLEVHVNFLQFIGFQDLPLLESVAADRCLIPCKPGLVDFTIEFDQPLDLALLDSCRGVDRTQLIYVLSLCNLRCGFGAACTII